MQKLFCVKQLCFTQKNFCLLTIAATVCHKIQNGGAGNLEVKIDDNRFLYLAHLNVISTFKLKFRIKTFPTV